ncbi:photosynthetic complex putative assembly protein PuhB [Methylobacterium sp. Leaf108]|uniref:photosynthetic complex putative assembly protein PuhB n=1 Tax=Methylobacterium sp. Leaf108 TaxID=1736256 RepID=UPI0006F624D8|nr:photosynthetic complex putative assembly protein PuhB [Methylobacterium sp. Leaf108]KQP59174.1 phosphopantetheine adenylyltransferase [Methylobacterium sp. Leaf108]
MSESVSLPPNAFDAPPGLPAPLPAGEHVLWQGRPRAAGIAFRTLHVGLVAAWFSGLTLWAGVPLLAEGRFVEAAVAVGPTLALGAGAIGLLALIGWLTARSTTYTITNRRLVMRYGVALPMTLNLPFALIEDAGLRRFRDGTGDLPILLRSGNRVAYLHLWPHARPWHVSRPEPMMRSVPDAGEVASILARAIAATLEPQREESASPVIVARPRSAPRPPRLAAAS